MSPLHRPAYRIRRAEKAEAGLILYHRLASLLCHEMPGHSLDEVRAVMAALPDVSSELIEAGRYFVADCGEMVGGAGWSVLPLRFQGSRLADPDGGPADLALGDDSVLVRGFFLDPDVGRRGAGAELLAKIEADAAEAGHGAGELLIPATAEVYYRSLGFKRVRKLALRLDRDELLPILQMRRSFRTIWAEAA
jgi:hypothetical protein